MELTKTQQDLKEAIVNHLLKVKQDALDELLQLQSTDEGQAQEAQEDQTNLYEDGKLDQVRNRIEARAKVADAHAREINLLNGIHTIEPTEEIQLGDVVHTDQGKFFVAVPAGEFTVNGETYRGISTESPLFKALLGKHDGDKVSVNGNEFTLKKSF